MTSTHEPVRSIRSSTADGTMLLIVVGLLGSVVSNVIVTTTGPDAVIRFLTPIGPALLLAGGGFLLHRPFVAGSGTNPRFRTWSIALSALVLPVWWATVITERILRGTPPSFGPVDHLVTGLLLQAPLPDVRSALSDSAWIVSAPWIFGLLLPAWNTLVRRGHRRLRLAGSPRRSQLIGLGLPLVITVAVGPLRSFAPIIAGAAASTLRADHRSTSRGRSRRSVGSARSIRSVSIIAIPACTLLLIVGRGRSGSIAGSLVDDPMTTVVVTLLAGACSIVFLARPLRKRLLPRGINDSTTTVVAFSIGLLFWHDVVLRSLIESSGPDLRTPSVIVLCLIGGGAASFASLSLLQERLRRIPVVRDAIWALRPAGSDRGDRDRAGATDPRPSTVGPRRHVLDVLGVIATIVLVAHRVLEEGEVSTGRSPVLTSVAFIAVSLLVVAWSMRLHLDLLTPRSTAMNPALKRIAGVLALHWTVLVVAFVHGDLDHLRGFTDHLTVLIAFPSENPAFPTGSDLGLARSVLAALLWSMPLVWLHARLTTTFVHRRPGIRSAAVAAGLLIIVVALLTRSGSHLLPAVTLWSMAGVLLSTLITIRQTEGGRRRLRRVPPAMVLLLIPPAGFVLIGSLSGRAGSAPGSGDHLVEVTSAALIAMSILVVMVVEPPRAVRRLVANSGRRPLGGLIIGTVAWYPMVFTLTAGHIESDPIVRFLIVLVASVLLAEVGTRWSRLLASPDPHPTPGVAR